ncbi:hypothetical protein, partial [Microcoleus sp. MON2_D5]|uniref:hypothetical protein n=1 Tax=Microcoleus sp. MON2_D5 TaxID=2818833 RepID=UPI002FCF5793
QVIGRALGDRSLLFPRQQKSSSVNLVLKYGNILAYWSARSIKGARTAMLLTNSSEREPVY